MHNNLTNGALSTGVCSNSCPLSQCCCLTISSSAALSSFLFCLSQHQLWNIKNVWIAINLRINSILVHIKKTKICIKIETFKEDGLIGDVSSQFNRLQQESKILQEDIVHHWVLSIIIQNLG